MSSRRLFHIALLISTISHGVILSLNPDLTLFPNNKRKQAEKIEVSYIKELKKPQQEPLLNTQAKIRAEKSMPAPLIDKENIFNKSNKGILPKSDFIKPIIAKPDIIAIRKKITLSNLDMVGQKINSAAYIAHSQIVREKIKHALRLNYSGTETGEIYLTFVVYNNGNLRQARILQERSSTNSYLKGIVLKSINDASPFPKFPEELNYPELTFSVIISFEVE